MIFDFMEWHVSSLPQPEILFMRSAALLASIGEMQGYRNRLCARKGQLDPDVWTRLRGSKHKHQNEKRLVYATERSYPST
jgi:hypothetical protein